MIARCLLDRVNGVLMANSHLRHNSTQLNSPVVTVGNNDDVISIVTSHSCAQNRLLVVF